MSPLYFFLFLINIPPSVTTHSSPINLTSRVSNWNLSWKNDLSRPPKPLTDWKRSLKANYERDECEVEEISSRPEFDPSDYFASSFNYDDNVIKLGVLASYKSSKLFLGAALLAVSEVNSNENILKGRKLELSMKDVGNSGSEAYAALSIRRMTEMLREGVVAFIGPDDKCANEALVAAAWNLPMISYKCADKEVSNKTKYYTFARTLPPSSKVVKAIVSLLQKFEWKKFTLLTETTTGYFQIAEAFKVDSS
ncbi:UNVERIFIED_CONTAM: hypothetical protein RMT77_012702 [Armadillidium vulgare]